MRLFHSSIRCPHCGAPIRLHSFRPPPLRCAQCGELRDPQALRENIGCVAFLPGFVVVALVCGYLGSLAGNVLAPAAGVQDLSFRLAFLGGADGLGLAVLLYWRTMGGPRAASALAPLAVFLTFMALGRKCGHGFGIAWLFVWGLANGLFGFAVALPLVPRSEPPMPKGG